MRPGGPRYPVDRYLVESSKIEMVNIIDDDIWNPEPALRPEEEIILRKLHEMLQSTADDLKLLSGDLAAQRASTHAHVRAAPAPLDEQFNEKVHIEQVVNAKFHGYKMVDKPAKLNLTKKLNETEKKIVNKDIQQAPSINKKPPATRQLSKSRTRIVHIDAAQGTKEGKEQSGKKPNKETVIYNEFTFQYPTAKVESYVKDLRVQTMPSINIRGELKEQKVLQLDIEPEPLNTEFNSEPKCNVGVISIQHEFSPSKAPAMKIPQTYATSHIPATTQHNKPVRKFTKIIESSSSSNNVSSDLQHNIVIPKARNTKSSSKTSLRLDRNKMYKNAKTEAESPKRTHLNLDEWKKKLSSVYGQPSGSKNNKMPPKSKGIGKKSSPKKSNVPLANVSNPQPKLLNNAQYIPYSQLTLGGVNVSDIEKEISHVPNKNNIPLSPILDKILSSRENSRKNSPRKNKERNSPKILTTSDENLLQEVIDIERTVSKTLSKNTEIRVKDNTSQIDSSDSTNKESNEPSYADDFEDEKSDKSDKHSNASQLNSDGKSTNKISNRESTDSNAEDVKIKYKTSSPNKMSSKAPSLSFKKHVDVFEFVHEIDTQETATQSQITDKISLKETQTSPRSESENIPVEPIHNDLWPEPCMDPSNHIEKMFKVEKDLIKKLIMDEYGDLLQNAINKPSTSKNCQNSLGASLNLNASQKVTQTSPKHAKSVMTSPTRTKTRTTSPFHPPLPVDRETSPMIFVTDEKDHLVKTEQEPEDLGISINLSSPRFSLRLPNTSLEVLSNLEICSNSPSVNRKRDSSMKLKPVTKSITSSTSIDADNSSSEISSLGEVKLKLKRKLRKCRVSSSSESSTTSSSMLSVDFNSISILPLRSEGELSSVHRPVSRNTNVPSKSEGEISLGKR